jgi:cob(I)alamin adenosyltransferase
VAQRIYTRSGDSGETGLFGGQRAPKSATRIEALGAVDELNSALGVAAAECGDPESTGMARRIQRSLFTLGAQLSAPALGNSPIASLPSLSQEHVAGLEDAIDRFESSLPDLAQFILPGGSKAGAQFHLARAVCRRAERACVRLNEQSPLDPVGLRYRNRLSDLLFVMARAANQRLGAEETTWSAECAP